MSIQTTRPNTDTCDHPDCEESYPEPNGIAGHCSQDCADRHRGLKLLRDIRQDHRFCWSCWRPQKTIEQPTEEYENRAFRRSGTALTHDRDGEVSVQRYGQEVSRDAVVGFEHHTRFVTRGPHGLECECAAIDHDIEGWDKREEGPYHWQLKLVVEQQREEGQHNKHLDLSTFADVLWETDNLELAVGRALR